MKQAPQRAVGHKTLDTDPSERASGRSFVAWLIALGALTGLGALPAIVAGLDLSTFSPASPPPAIVSAGVELTAFAPSLAAFLVAGLFLRPGGVGALLRQVRRWRVGLGWYVVALGGSTAVSLLALAVQTVIVGRMPPQWLVLPTAAQAFGLIGGLVVGPLGEEFGWRGFALPRLQRRLGALGASVVLGVIWATWHQWPELTPGTHAFFTLSLAVFMLRLVALAILFAWLYNSTKGALLVPMVAHAGHNLANHLVPAASALDAALDRTLLEALLYLAAAGVVVALTSARTLTRARRASTDPTIAV